MGEPLTRRRWMKLGGLSAAAALGVLGAQRSELLDGTEQARFHPAGAGSARRLIQERHLPNVPLVTHDGEPLRFYDDLVKDKKVVLTFITTRVQHDSRNVLDNLAVLQRFFGSRVGSDIFLYSIARDPEHDTPAALKRWAERYGVGWSRLSPGRRFLTGDPGDVERLRRSLGFASADPAEDVDPAYSVGLLRYGVEREMRWAHCESQSAPRALAHAMLLDFGPDPGDPNPPPVFECRRIADRIARLTRS